MATVTSLADSRFDWERVMRELSLVLPADVWLTEPHRDGSRRERRAVRGRRRGLRGAVPGPGAGNERLRGARTRSPASSRR